MKYVIAAVFLMVFAASAQAQTGTPTSWKLAIYAGTTVVSTTTVTAAQVQCNQPAPTGSTENPKLWSWDDVANAGKKCVFDDTARLVALPDGSYTGGVTAVNADGQSAESARAPFTRRRPNPPAVPTGVSLSQ